MDVVVVFVNGALKRVPGESLDYEGVIGLADLNPAVNYSITYRNAAGAKPEGTMSRSDSVEIRPYTVFNVALTGDA